MPHNPVSESKVEMLMEALSERFEIAGLRYTLSISNTGRIIFVLTGGTTRRGAFQPHFFFDETESVHDINLLTVNPIRVFRYIKKRLLAWVGSQKPHQFSFAGCNPRRSSIYRWMAHRLAKSLPNYHLYELEGSFYFFRNTDYVRSKHA